MAQTSKSVLYWLYFLAFAVLLMMFIGALTRLTESGLSIVVWEPLSGAIPPLSHEQWQRYFELYKKTPEFMMINNWMKLEDFQGIFWLEYIHRLWGRLMGAFFIIPLIYFYARKIVDKKFALKMLGIFALGGLQGLVGWVMVQSGLSNNFSVSHYRLAAHLLIAVLIYSLILWTAFNLKNPNKSKGCNMAFFARVVIGMIIFMMLLGAFVAGRDAGFAYNTFPLMDGKIIPNNIYKMQPLWINHFENGIMLQFQHRIFAYILSAVIAIFAILLTLKNFRYINLSLLILCVLILQFSLGVATLLSFGTYADFGSTFAYHKVLHTPVLLAAFHQLGAVLLLSAFLATLHRLTHEK